MKNIIRILLVVCSLGILSGCGVVAPNYKTGNLDVLSTHDWFIMAPSPNPWFNNGYRGNSNR